MPHASIPSHVNFLPSIQRGDIAPDLAQTLSDRAEREVVWAIADPSDGGSGAAAEEFYGCLYAMGAFEKLSGQVSEADRDRWNSFLSQWSAALMPRLLAEQLAAPDRYAQLVRAALFSPFSGVSAQELSRDPLLLSRARQFLSFGSLSFVDGWLTASDEAGRSWRIIVGVLKPGALSHPYVLGRIALEEKVARASVAALYPQVRIVGMGTFFQAERSLEQSLGQIRLLGFPLVVFFFILFVFFLRSLRPFLLWLLACMLGTAFGMTAVFLLYGEIHVHVLAMGAALCGITAAIVLFWLASCRQPGHRGRTLFVQWLYFSWLIAFSFVPIGWVPFAESREIAVLAVTGMLSVLVTCAVWYPFLCRRLAWRFQPWEDWLGIASCVFLCVVAAAGLGAENLGLFSFHRSADAMPNTARGLHRLLGEDEYGRNFVVTGITLEEALVKSEELGEKLDELRQRGVVASWSPISLPSQKRQHQNYHLVEQAYGAVKEVLSSQGIALTSNPYSGAVLPFSQWKNSSFGRLEWARVAQAYGMWAVVVYVRAPQSSWPQLAKLGQNLQVYWLNPLARQKQEIHEAQQALFVLLFSLLILSWLGLAVCRGVKQSLFWLTPGVLGAISCICFGSWHSFPNGVFAFLGVPIALACGVYFSVLASQYLLPLGTRLLGITL